MRPPVHIRSVYCSFNHPSTLRYQVKFHLVSLLVCVSTWQNVMLGTATAAGAITEVGLSTLPSAYMSVDRFCQRSSTTIVQAVVKTSQCSWNQNEACIGGWVFTEYSCNKAVITTENSCSDINMLMNIVAGVIPSHDSLLLFLFL